MNHNEFDKSVMDIEFGGSVFELIEFTLTRELEDGTKVQGLYGVNVAKVREVIRMPKMNPLGSTVSAIPGIFELRGVPIPAVNLCRVLGDHRAKATPEQQLIVAEFSNKRAGFIVHSTKRIRRVAWENVLPPSTDNSSCMTGMILIENNEFLFILDLEKILLDLEAQSGQGQPYPTQPMMMPMMPQQMMAHASWSNADMQQPSIGRVLLVDDSKLIIDGVKQALKNSGFSVVTANNGVEALSALDASATDEKGIDIVITDIEMPQMDGMTFTRKLREHPIFSHLPVIFHSSLSGQASMTSATSAGADGYVVKNDVKALVATLKRVLSQRSPASA